MPRVIVTDKLKSYAAAKCEVLPSVGHRQHRYVNNRPENSHQPTRQSEQRMQEFKSPGQAQRFLAAYGPIAQHFRPRRHRFSTGGVITCMLIFRITVAMGFRDPQVVNEICVMEE